MKFLHGEVHFGGGVGGEVVGEGVNARGGHPEFRDGGGEIGERFSAKHGLIQPIDGSIESDHTVIHTPNELLRITSNGHEVEWGFAVHHRAELERLAFFLAGNCSHILVAH